MMKPNDLTLGMNAGSDSSGTFLPLDPNNSWDKRILDEAELLCKWSGISAQLYHTTGGTCATGLNHVRINKTQLDTLFGTFDGEEYQTCIFFALAHEFGHLCQFKVFGVHETIAKPRIEVEAHADYLSGVWLAIRLAMGEERNSEYLVNAGLQLKSDTEDYPTNFQRSQLVTTGQSQGVMLIISEDQVKKFDKKYVSMAVSLTDQDVGDTYNIARKTLRETPAEWPI